MYTEKLVVELVDYSNRLGKVIEILEGKDSKAVVEPATAPKPIRHHSPAAIRHMRLGQQRRWRRIRAQKKRAA